MCRSVSWSLLAVQTGRLEMERNTAGSEPGLYFDLQWTGVDGKTSERWPNLGLVTKMINHSVILCRKAAFTFLLHQYKED